MHVHLCEAYALLVRMRVWGRERERHSLGVSSHEKQHEETSAPSSTASFDASDM